MMVNKLIQIVRDIETMTFVHALMCSIWKYILYKQPSHGTLLVTYYM